MTPEQWQKVFALVRASRGRAELASLPTQNGAEDEEILKAAQSLLLAHRQMGSFLERSVRGMFSATQQNGGSDTPTEQVASPLIEPPTFSPTELSLPRGATLGRYVVLSLLGKGGMGVVYAAYDPELDRKVAIKLLSPEGPQAIQGTDGKARLLREAKAMARLSHVNVITVHDVGTLGEDVFVAMEYVDGGTLKQWLEEKPRKWRDIVEMFVQAGRGLAAAHAAGIVHRDFKPDNVLIGKDGRPRVLDFGLARGLVPADAAQTIQLIGHGQSATPVGPMALAEAVTKAGALIGTPAYMAPEQLAGKDVDARTDQFSFCVALYQALYGELPFEGDTVRERLAAIERGRLRSPPSSNSVPKWLRKVLSKVLTANPEERYPTMEELLHKLQRNPKRAWTRLAAGTAALLVLGGMAFAYYRSEYNKRQTCRGAEAHLAAVWGEPQKKAMSDAFLRTGLPYAADAVRSVTRTFDEYGRRWAQMETEACEAHRRGAQSGELLDLRMSCLAQRREELKTLANVFGKADNKVVEKSVSAAQGLSDIEGCADVEALKAPLKPPSDKTAHAKVEEVRLTLAQVYSLRMAAKDVEALPMAEQAVKEAEALGYRPLLAESLMQLGTLLVGMGKFREGEEAMLRAAFAAESTRHDVVAAEAWARLSLGSFYTSAAGFGEFWAKLSTAAIERLRPNTVPRIRKLLLFGIGNIAATQGKYDEALEHYRGALAAAEQGNRPTDVAEALGNIALALQRKGEFDEAFLIFQRSLALFEQAYGSIHPMVASILNAIGVNFFRQERYEQALTYFQRSLEIAERSRGPDHPSLVSVLENIGELFLWQKNYAGAMQYFQRALVLRQKAYGEQHPFLAYTLLDVGRAHLGLGHPARALPLLEHALSVFESNKVEPEWRGDARFHLARALYALKREPKRARALAEQAREDFEKEGKALKKELAEVEEWLAKHFPQ